MHYRNTPWTGTALTIFLALSMVMTGCESPDERTSRQTSIQLSPVDTIEKPLPLAESREESRLAVDSTIPADSTLKQAVAAEPPRPTASWKTEQFIISCPDPLREELLADLNYYREAWKEVPRSLVAMYRGNSIGDYFHLDFEGKEGEVYDFGFGNNDFGNTVLYYDDEHYNDNPEYLNKTFRIDWQWKISSYPCCSGEYEMVKTYMPSITKLQLLADDQE